MVEEFDALKRWYPSKYSFPSRGLAYARVVPPKYCILQKLRRSLETCPMFIVPITDRLDGIAHAVSAKLKAFSFPVN